VAAHSITSPFGKNDHAVVRTYYKSPDSFPLKTNTLLRNFQHIYNYELVRIVNSFQWDTPNLGTVEEKWAALHSNILHLIERTVITSSKRVGTNKTYITRQVKRAFQRRREACTNWKAYGCLRDNTLALLRTEQYITTNLIKKRKACVAAMAKENLKRIFAHMGRNRRLKQRISTPFRNDGTMATDSI